jgi:hypothetical protein
MAFNQYLEGVITASLGTLLILFGLPYLSSIPRVGKNTPKRQALLTLFNYFQFFLSCVLLGATITIRVLIHHFDIDFNTAYIAAAIPVGALVALIGLLFFRFLMLAYGLFVGLLLGMLLEAGLHNIFDTQDEHACTGQVDHPHRGPPLCRRRREPFALGMVHSPRLRPLRCGPPGHEPQLLERPALRHEA